ncbi:MAG: 23S rRNA (guanosine(2251)-2'-O)-methyltransferase RlmB [FCB group bacterium]|jgi:23S rRNA (guanosine2251-2'-O)-methyltransferase
MENGDSYIIGRNAVMEALRSGQQIEKIFFCFGTQGPTISKIYSSAKRMKIPCTNLDKRKFATLEKSISSIGSNSQGVIALIRQIATIELKDMLQKSFENNPQPIIVALDNINDPHNLGAIARSAECAGVSGMILPIRDSAPITPAAIKASAGGLEHIKVTKVNNLTQALITCKEAGFWIIGTDSDGERLYTDNIYDRPVVLVIGSEGSGLRPGIRNQCDIIVKIPLLGKIPSLNASVSAGIILFEMLRQRIEK